MLNNAWLAAWLSTFSSASCNTGISYVPIPPHTSGNWHNKDACSVALSRLALLLCPHTRSIPCVCINAVQHFRTMPEALVPLLSPLFPGFGHP